jgi:hypothetical protein
MYLTDGERASAQRFARLAEMDRRDENTRCRARLAADRSASCECADHRHRPIDDDLQFILRTYDAPANPRHRAGLPAGTDVELAAEVDKLASLVQPYNEG